MVGVRTVFRDEPGWEAAYTVLVAVAHPEHVDQLMRTATALARANEGEIVVASVVHKPVTSPFLLFSPDLIGTQYSEGHPPVLDRAAEAGADASVPTSRHLLVGSDISEALLSAVVEWDADAMVVGWQDRSSASNIVLGATVDRVVSRAPCDVYVERVGTTADAVDSILLPTIGGPHVRPAVALAAAVSVAEGAAIEVVSYAEGETADREAATGFVEDTIDQLENKGVDCEGVVEDVGDGGDIPAKILGRAGVHDLVILGATRRPGLRRRVVGAVAEAVARRADLPVVIAKRQVEPTVLERLFDR